MKSNNAEPSYPATSCQTLVAADRFRPVHQLFEAHAARKPDEVALIDGQRRPSFGSLNRHAEILADRLADLGVGLEVPVAIFMERSALMVTAMLGVLKAGGAFVLIDPCLPAARVQFILVDTGTHIVLTRNGLKKGLNGCDTARLYLDDLEDDGKGSRARPVCLPENLGYIIYTSGSTGKPKGVLGLHGGLVDRMAWVWEQLPYEPDEVCCQKASSGFVDLIGEVFTPLCQGVPVVLIADDAVTNPLQFLQQLAEHRVTRVTLVPTLLRMILNTAVSLDQALPAMRLWICSGEELTEDLKVGFRARSTAMLCNTYGSAETSIEVTCWSEDGEHTDQAVPIGYPMEKVAVRVLEDNGEPCPPGTVAEMFLGGPCLARGYLNHPALTAASFLPDPVSGHARLFRTGDLVSCQENGLLIYHGRTDHQVKIGGKRVELGEIEQVLLRHPHIAEAVVKAWDNQGHKRLEAYLVPRSAHEIDLRELTNFLAEALPGYMVPATLVPMTSLPRTGSGKTNRAALQPHGRQIVRGPLHVAPRNSLERELASIWEQVLQLTGLGIHDHFFQLGGDSLLATRITNLAREHQNLEIPPHLVFEAPTVGEMALRLEKMLAGGQVEAPTTFPEPRDRPPLSFAQQRLWFLEQIADGAPIYILHGAMTHPGPLWGEALEQAITDLIRQHHILRTCFPAPDGIPFPRVHTAAPIPLVALDLTDLDEPQIREQTSRHMNLLARQRFHIGNGPLVRFFWFRLGQGRHLLFWTIHHLVCDHWSMDLIAAELTSRYSALVSGRTAALSSGPSFAAMAAADRARLDQAYCARLLEYWKSHLTPLPPPLELPRDRPPEHYKPFEGRHHYFLVPASLNERLVYLARELKATPYMLWMSAFSALLSRYCGQTELVIGTPVADRGRKGTPNMIGFLVHTLAPRFDLSGNPDFHSLIHRVSKVISGALVHAELPFEKLVEVMKPGRDHGRNSLFQGMFIYQGHPRSHLDGGFERIDPEIENQVSIFDLSLTLSEGKGTLAGEWEYNSSLFEPDRIPRLTSMLIRLVEAVVARPGIRLADLPLAEPRLRPRATVSFDKELPVHHLFESRAVCHPNAVALHVNGRDLTYTDLDQQSSRLAARLIAEGTGAGTRVGIIAARHETTLIALLGVLKTGAAFVPIHPEDPPKRAASIMADAQAHLLLTTREQNPPPGSFRLILLDEERDAPVPWLPAVSPESPAYVLYTSGTTGHPKGVVVSHRALVGHCRQIASLFQIGVGDRVLQFAPLCFDAALEQIFTALLSGAMLLLRDRLWSVAELCSRLINHGITHANLPTAFWHPWVREWASYPEGMADHQLRTVIVGGEALPQDGLADWERTADGVRLFNAYGPTEAVITATTRHLPRTGKDLRISIGQAVPGHSAVILDAHHGLAPIGVPGEIYLGGPALAQAYMGAPRLTAERFLPDPLSNRPGSRRYKTGDLAVYDSEGDIVFLGRRDQQVKIRGFRVEIGEIEAALRRHPLVHETVVLVTGSAPASMESVALDRPTLATALAALEPGHGQQLLSEIEGLTEGEAAHGLEIREAADSLTRRTPQLEIRLRIQDSSFIAPPSDFQRNWLLQRALDELLDDLNHLDRTAKRLIASASRSAIKGSLTDGKASYRDGKLLIDGQEVMQSWQHPLMKRMVDTLREHADHVLEIGFGMGISASMIQAFGVSSHTIIECNRQVIDAFHHWSQNYPESEIRLVEGKWQDVIDQLPDYDAILFDTFPLNEQEFDENVIQSVTFAEHFLPTAAAHLRPGGVLSYYTNEIDSFSRRHQRLLFRCFKSFSLSLVEGLRPPPDNQNWWADSMVVVKAVK